MEAAIAIVYFFITIMQGQCMEETAWPSIVTIVEDITIHQISDLTLLLAIAEAMTDSIALSNNPPTFDNGVFSFLGNQMSAISNIDNYPNLFNNYMHQTNGMGMQIN